MKIITLNQGEKAWIKKAKAQDSKAQQWLYEKYAAKMLSVCRQYVRDMQFAEDIMVNGFVKVFQNLGSFENRGSFEGWIRKIMVRESISYLRKKQFVVVHLVHVVADILGKSHPFHHRKDDASGEE